MHIINVGSVARDGTGDDLRTAFIKTNLNFADLYLAVGNLITNGSSSSSTFTGGTVSSLNVTGNLNLNGALLLGNNAGISGQVLVSTGSGLTWGNVGGGSGGNVVSVNGYTGIVVLNKSDVGLSNVDNTSDTSKPISSATQTALDNKEPTISAGTTAQYWRGDKSWQTLNKAAVGLSNVDNTSDVNKPVSTAQQTALDGKLSLTGGTLQTGSAVFGTALTIAESTDATSARAAVSIGNWLVLQDSNGDGTKNFAIYDGVAANTRLSISTAGQVYIPNGLSLGSALIAGGSAGINGQVLVSTGTGIAWGNISGGNSSSGVSSVNGYTGIVTLSKTDIGLGNVDNTSDVNKPVSTAQQTALNLKANIAGPTFTGTVTVSALSAGGTLGNVGQVLTSTGTGVQWAATGGYTPPSSNISNVVFTGLGTTQAAVDTVSTTGVTVVHYEVCAIDTVNSRYKGSRITIVSDGTTATMTEYGVVKSNTSFNVAVFACDISGGNIRLLGTGDSTSVTVILTRTTQGTGTTAGPIARV